MISPAAVISLCDDIVQRTMISSHCSDCGIFHLSIMCGCPHPTVIPSVAWESSRQAHFAPLDCHVATLVAPRNDKMKIWIFRLRQRRNSPSRQSCETTAGVFVPARTDSKDFLRGSDCENKRGSRQYATECCRCLCAV